jgi:hypothetical protein
LKDDRLVRFHHMASKLLQTHHGRESAPGFRV